MRKIIIAESAGFCFGVKRSVEIAEKTLSDYGKCSCYGELIHNNDVIDSLTKKGMKIVYDAASLTTGEKVIIRAHGISEREYTEIENSGAAVVDATCPKVKAIHKIVRKAADEGRFVIIIGMRNHPEVEAICGWCGEHAVFDNPEEAALFFKNNTNSYDLPVTVVSQTTQTRKNFTECSDIIKKRCTNSIFFDTICDATSMRQKEAAQLASQCDAMVVVGGKHSANSIHLSEICMSKCDNTQFISSPDELDTGKFSGCNLIGITAGASTPAWIIKEVSKRMSDEIKVEERELSFDEMLEESLKPIYNGDKVSGIVVAITGTEVSVDLGTKYSGFIPTEEFADGNLKAEDAVKVGDLVEAVVVRVNDVEGTAQLSKKRLDAAKVWIDLEDAVEKGTVLEGVVTEENKGGVVVNVKGIRVFVPASQTDVPKDAELSQLLKQSVKLKITEVNKARKRVVGSIRQASRLERRSKIEAFWNEIEVGKKYTGVVKSLTSFGAFVDIGGVDGMVHVSELSWGRINNPAEVVSVGDEIEVFVIGFDPEKHKISLGYKKPEDNPWTVFTQKYSVGDTANVKIVKLVDFGAFAEIVDGVDGLIHISQIANRRIAKPADELTVGQLVDAKITAIDEEKHKVSLSIRALSEPAPEAEVKAEAEEETDDAVVFAVSENGETSGEVPFED